jgi:hypothetical protein
MFIFDLLCAKHVIMEVKIKYEDIISYCEKLSSFEADRKVDANGESRYLELHINEVDKQLIQQYIVQARAILEERMERMIENIEEGIFPNETIPFDFISSIIPDNVVDWLDDRSPVAYFTNGDAFAYYQETNIGVYDVQYIDDDDPKYGYDGSLVDTVYLCKKDGKRYKWHPTSDGLVEYLGEKGFTWSIRTTTRWNGIKTFVKHIHEAIASYVMSAWLKGKLDDRVPFYEGLFNTTLSSAVKNVFTKQAPKYE